MQEAEPCFEMMLDEKTMELFLFIVFQFGDRNRSQLSRLCHLVIIGPCSGFLVGSSF